MRTQPQEALACDVLVAGGGVAGTAAAVAAARSGCAAVLIEKERSLGGIGTRGMLRTICGLYANGGAEPVDTLNTGLAREIVAGLLLLAPDRRPTTMGKVRVLPYDSGDLARVLAGLSCGEAGLTVLFDAAAVSVTAAYGRVFEAIVEQNGVRRVVKPTALIDCTGSGEVSSLAGAEYDIAAPGEVQLAGFTVHVRGLQAGDGSLPLKVPYVMAKAAERKGLSPAMRFTTFSSGDCPDEGYLKFSVDGPDSAERRSQAEAEAGVAVRTLAEQLPAFRKAVIAGTSGQILEREGKRVRGEYVLTAEDVLSGRKFPDGVVKNAWPIELWDREKGPVYRYLPPAEHYEIPFRCMTVKGFSNLLTAGRCISVTREALGSARVMGACMALGDIAGQAAAGLVKNGKYPTFAAGGK